MEYCSVSANEKDVQNCRAWVEEEMLKAKMQLTSKELDLLTIDIMESSAMMGGGYEENDIRGVCQQYIDSNFYHRFLRLHKNELGNRLFKL